MTHTCGHCGDRLHCYSSRSYGEFQRRSFKCRSCGWRPSPASMMVRRELIRTRVTISR
jgi:hypothetical protein